MKQVYCPDCNEMVEVRIGEREETTPFRGEKITISAKYAACSKCGQEFFLPETHDVNLKNIQDEYRRLHNLLSPELIRSIRSQYDLSAKSFAKVLGLGEISITRYENGYVQEEAQNNLISLAREPRNFSELFERNKDKLTGDEIKRVCRKIRRAKTFVVFSSYDDWDQDSDYNIVPEVSESNSYRESEINYG